MQCSAVQFSLVLYLWSFLRFILPGNTPIIWFGSVFQINYAPNADGYELIFNVKSGTKPSFKTATYPFGFRHFVFTWSAKEAKCYTNGSLIEDTVTNQYFQNVPQCGDCKNMLYVEGHEGIKFSLNELTLWGSEITAEQVLEELQGNLYSWSLHVWGLNFCLLLCIIICYYAIASFYTFPYIKVINLYCEANGKLLAQAGFELAPSGMSPTENDVVIQPIKWTTVCSKQPNAHISILSIYVVFISNFPYC